jgi:hypothetical protein
MLGAPNYATTTDFGKTVQKQGFLTVLGVPE